MKADLIRGSLAMSGRVIRYACWPTITNQTVGEHCWHIARIYTAIFGTPTWYMAAYIQNHDSGELIVGDPPFPAKRDNPDLKAACDRIEIEALDFLGVELPELTIMDKARFKVCDLLEMTEYGMYERELGNRLAVPIILRTEEAAWNTARAGGLPDDEIRLMEVYLGNVWERHEAVIRSAEHPKTITIWDFRKRCSERRAKAILADRDSDQKTSDMGANK